MKAHGDGRNCPTHGAESYSCGNLCGVGNETVKVLTEVVSWVRVGGNAQGMEGITHVRTGDESVAQTVGIRGRTKDSNGVENGYAKCVCAAEDRYDEPARTQEAGGWVATEFDDGVVARTFVAAEPHVDFKRVGWVCNSKAVREFDHA